jgi:hypothetical protein
VTKEELVEFLKESLTISINRDQDYYSYPHLEVELLLDGEIISSCITTIYDGDQHG